MNGVFIPDNDSLLLSTGTSLQEDVQRNKRQGVESISIHHATRKTSITFVIAAMWAPLMPPYNLARLIGITREAGYKTYAFDFNIESYHFLKFENEDMKDAWEPGSYWWWDSKEQFDEKVFPHYQDLLDEYVDQILETESDIVGFTVYITNIHSTNYIASQLKKLRPDITILYGGPECMRLNADKLLFDQAPWVDYFFVGESEQNIFDFLENWEKEIKPKNKIIGSLFGKKRADIDSFPFPDYTDFDLHMYKIPNAVCTELTRGCVARCTYCEEVWYWKFRDREGHKVVDEIMTQYKNHGTTFVFFADSLMNGNIKGYRDFLEAKVKADPEMKVSWVGYLRADKRMDDDFYKLMHDAGAKSFNYGFESGSQKVLDSVNKKNKVEDIEANIILSEKHKINTVALWIIGAPEEDHEAFAHSLNLLWNHRRRIHSVSPGTGLLDLPGTAYDDREKFNLNERRLGWIGGWWTKDLLNTRLHRYLRVKHMHMWIKICNDYEMPKIHEDGDNLNKRIQNSHDCGDINKHFHIEHTIAEEDANVNIPYEYDFDYNIIKSDLGPFQNSLMNEVFVLLRMIWRARGAFKITLNYNNTPSGLDSKDFEYMFSHFEGAFSYYYVSEVNFNIDEDGNFEIHNKYSYKELEHNPVDNEDRSFEYEYKSKGKWE